MLFLVVSKIATTEFLSPFARVACSGKTERMFVCPLISNPERAPLARLRGAGGVLKGVFYVI